MTADFDHSRWADLPLELDSVEISVTVRAPPLERRPLWIFVWEVLFKDAWLIVYRYGLFYIC